MTAPPPSRPKTVVIETPDGPIFGWYHAAPDSGPKTGTGVVLCNPLGYEAVCSHSAYRELAARLAAAGHPALRFDYHGTGDSSGTDRDPRRFEAMIASIDAAAAALRSLSGAADISLFGVRMGATLAMYAASGMGGVTNLIAWAPCVKGKTYLREMNAFRKMAEKNLGRAPKGFARADGDEEAGGYLMTKDTVAALSKLNLLELQNSPARSILIIPREGVTEDPALLASLRRGGSDAAEEAVAGYSSMMIELHASVLPDRVFDAILRWLSTRPGGAKKEPSRAAAVSTTGTMRIRPQGVESEVEEHAVYFGSDRGLFGIVSENADKERRSKTAVIFLNAGLIPRYGPNRLHTRFARQWAALGAACFRIDLSGIGDSRGTGHPEELMFSDTTVNDVKETMDFLRSTRAIDRFVLVGLCSGAHTAFHAGLHAESIAAEILLNPPTFYWRPGGPIEFNQNETLYYQRALFRKESWLKALRGKVDFLHILKVAIDRTLNIAKAGIGAAAKLFPGRRKSQNDLLLAFRGMAKRGINTLLIFSQDDAGLHYVEKRLGRRAAKVSGSNFKLEIVAGADHTFSPIWSQDYLCALLTDHIARLLKT